MLNEQGDQQAAPTIVQRPILIALKLMRDALSAAGYTPGSHDGFRERHQALMEGRIPAVTAEHTHATGLKVLGIAAEALNEAGHSVRVLTTSDPHEFHLEIDGVEIPVNVEVV